jgi:hypothetical protein
MRLHDGLVDLAGAASGVLATSWLQRKSPRRAGFSQRS